MLAEDVCVTEGRSLKKESMHCWQGTTPPAGTASMTPCVLMRPSVTVCDAT